LYLLLQSENNIETIEDEIFKDKVQKIDVYNDVRKLKNIVVEKVELGYTRNNIIDNLIDTNFDFRLFLELIKKVIY
jgi:hypothetical protein